MEEGSIEIHVIFSDSVFTSAISIIPRRKMVAVNSLSLSGAIRAIASVNGATYEIDPSEIEYLGTTYGEYRFDPYITERLLQAIKRGTPLPKKELGKIMEEELLI